MSRFNDILHMRQAIDLARMAWGQTHPNPLVGAVVVDHGEIVGAGYHARAGEAHAEVEALKQVSGKSLSGEAALFVTLEPCSTSGRTPPCTEAIIQSGIRRVVIGATDPNPRHSGRAVDILRAAGLTVECGLMAEDCADLNLIFNHSIVHETPFLAAKLATTIDGRVATRSGHSQWITGEAARAEVHRLRHYFPAIAVGTGTAIADNPRLTARLEGHEECCPRRFIFDRSLQLAAHPGHHLLSDAYAASTTLITTARPPEGPLRVLEEMGVCLWRCGDDTGQHFFQDFKQRCHAEGITGVLVEGGPHLLSELLAQQQLDYLYAFRAPRLLADDFALPIARGLNPETISEGIYLQQVRHANFGDDQLMRGYICYP